MSVSATGRATSLFLLFQVSTGKEAESGNRERKGRTILSFTEKAFRSMKKGKADVLKSKDLTHPCVGRAWSNDHQSNVKPSTNINGLWLLLLTSQKLLGTLVWGELPLAPLSWDHPCSKTATTPPGAATLPRYPWISSSTSYWGLPLRTPFIISESGDDSSPLSDSIGNPCLTPLSDKPGSQPLGPLKAFEVPEN